MSGNLCRCGAYVNIVAAIGDVAAEASGTGSSGAAASAASTGRAAR